METSEKKVKARSKEYPAITLGQAIEFVTKLKDYPVGKPISYDAAAKALNVSASTKSFTYAISAARQYGLVSTSAGGTLTFLSPANRLVRPTESVQELTRLKVQCFTAPKLYGELINQYNGRSMPPVKILENVLINSYGITTSAAQNAAQTFIDTADEVGAVQNGVLNLDVNIESTSEYLTVKPSTAEPGANTQVTNAAIDVGEEFDKPLSIPFGDQRRALLYMPLDIESDDAEYALEMIKLMFKKVYGVKS